MQPSEHNESTSTDQIATEPHFFSRFRFRPKWNIDNDWYEYWIVRIQSSSNKPLWCHEIFFFIPRFNFLSAYWMHRIRLMDIIKELLFADAMASCMIGFWCLRIFFSSFAVLFIYSSRYPQFIFVHCVHVHDARIRAFENLVILRFIYFS